MPLPFLGRISIPEYVALFGSFVLVGLEAIIRVLTLALPTSLLNLFYRASRRLFNRLASPAQRRATQRRKSVSSSVRNASDFVELCAMYGYTAEEHVVQTKDGFLLGIHRLAWRKGEEDMKVNSGPASIKKRVLYLHHGLLMNSEVWVSLTDAQRCLPFVLVDQGFDVWLGNNRGNKYSKKSIHHSPATIPFWNFSIDEFAFYDIPDSIQYILDTTGQPSLSYIGFSQGTAQAFASLSVHPKLNEQVNVFIALAPAMAIPGLHNGIVDALIKTSPQVLFLLFGRRSILSSATMWQSILYPPLFIKLIDMGNSFLFGWKSKNISVSQKLAAYPHLYSFTSTKAVVHWFQIIRNNTFQMYDDDVQSPLGVGSANKYTKIAKYPTRNIRTPIVIVYGGSDSLVDIKAWLKELPNRTIATEIPHYEHLDFLWARDVDSQVFRHVFDALDNFTSADNSLEDYESYQRARDVSLSVSASFKQYVPSEFSAVIRIGANSGSSHRPSDAIESDTASVLSTVDNGADPVQHQAREEVFNPSPVPDEKLQEEKGYPHLHPIDTINENAVATPERTSTGTLDGTAESPSSSTPSPLPAAGRLNHRRRGSAASNLSIGSMKGGKGIKIRAARPADSIVTTGSSDEGSNPSRPNGAR
ncbi:alpha/beta-hydrolase [Xylariaceae sp. FL0804]|nr:alpha/beta-hydrolase [Xylariaceae sp. FL0804]